MARSARNFVSTFVFLFLLSGVPQAVAALIAAGYGSTCVVGTDVALDCWGTSDYGELGIGVVSPRNMLVTPNLGGIREVVAGGSHICTRSDDQTWRWGANDQGQLGIGTTGSLCDQGNVDFLPFPGGAGMRSYAMSAGTMHTCAIAEQAFGAGIAPYGLQCWGWNTSGQLGDCTSTNRTLPVKVRGLASIPAGISAAGSWR